MPTQLLQIEIRKGYKFSSSVHLIRRKSIPLFCGNDECANKNEGCISGIVCMSIQKNDNDLPLMQIRYSKNVIHNLDLNIKFGAFNVAYLLDHRSSERTFTQHVQLYVVK